MSRAILRAPTIEDDARRRLWASDGELNGLAPVVRAASVYTDYAIEADGNHIGYCSIYNVTPDKAELGIVIGDRGYWNKGYGADVVNQLTEFCFNYLGVKHVLLRVLHSNLRAIRCYQKCGFTRYGVMTLDGNSFMLMVCSQDGSHA